MNALADIFSRYSNDCDKGTVHSYVPIYDELLRPYRRPGVTMVEIGIFRGGSLRMWEDYFAAGTVHGIDLCDQPLGLADLRPLIAEGTHNVHLFDAASRKQVDARFGDTKFDVVIDDASHALSQQLALYENFRHRLAPGGIYIIEDIQYLDADRATFERMDDTRQVRIVDRRSVKGRYDDVLVIIGPV